MPTSRRILVAVSASVAIHRALDLVSEIRKRGDRATVLMTPNAAKLVTPFQFQAISGERVFTDVFTSDGDDAYDHLTVTEDAAAFVFAPATADLLARLAAGAADDMVTTAALTFTGIRLLCPAMNTRMWDHPFVQRNLRVLLDAEYSFVPPDTGTLACGDVGQGRLAQVSEIIASLYRQLARSGPSPR